MGRKKLYRTPDELREHRRTYYQANVDKIKANAKAYGAANLDKIKVTKKAYRAANVDKIKANAKAYRAANVDQTKAYKKAYRAANVDQIKAYRAANVDKIKANEKTYRKAYRMCAANLDKINDRARERYKTDIQYKLSNLLRSRLGLALKNNQKTGSAVKDLGCSIVELQTHLESKFQSGMTWDNWSFEGWHIDHVKPLASFDLADKEQFLKANHYTNLQPLWAKDNMAKSDKIISYNV